MSDPKSKLEQALSRENVQHGLEQGSSTLSDALHRAGDLVAQEGPTLLDRVAAGTGQLKNSLPERAQPWVVPVLIGVSGYFAFKVTNKVISTALKTGVLVGGMYLVARALQK